MTQPLAPMEIIDLTRDEEEPVETLLDIVLYVRTTTYLSHYIEYRYLEVSALTDHELELIKRVRGMVWEDIVADTEMCTLFGINVPGGSRKMWHLLEKDMPDTWDDEQDFDDNMVLTIPDGCRVTQIVNIFENE